ncbi:MAG: DUF4124 domain-containing protein [Gammaproteobacteria bacterium]|nr:DUF4124 domain-containing protein [Gammaproteobacteria bacterium]
MRTLALLIALALASGAAQAEKVYKVIQPDGTVEFTDDPRPGETATEVKVEPLNTTPPLATPAQEAGLESSTTSSGQTYSEFRITSPDDNAALRVNNGNVDVDLALEPPLRSGDTIDIMLNGTVVGGGKQTAITLSNVDRGSHTVQAVVKNGAGEVVARSNTVSFSLQRRSAILQPSPPPPRVPPPTRPVHPTPGGG